MNTTAIFAGVIVAFAVALFGRFTGLERDRAFYPTMMIVIASYYALFAEMGATSQTLLQECIAILVFVIASVVGYKGNLWIVAVALVGHGVFDFFHHRMISNPGVPTWWPEWCLSYDVVAGAYLAWLLWSGGGPKKADS